MCLQVSPGLQRQPSYPVSGEHLGPVLVDNPNVSRRLDPGLSVHLHRHALLTQDGNLHRATLSKYHSVTRAPSSPRSLTDAEHRRNLPVLQLAKAAALWSSRHHTHSQPCRQSIPVQVEAHGALGSVLYPHCPLAQHCLCDCRGNLSDQTQTPGSGLGCMASNSHWIPEHMRSPNRANNPQVGKNALFLSATMQGPKTVNS